MEKLKEKVASLVYKYSPAIIGGWLVAIALSLYKWPCLFFGYLLAFIIALILSD